MPVLANKPDLALLVNRDHRYRAAMINDIQSNGFTVRQPDLILAQIENLAMKNRL